jgi:hypothetical protein
MEKRRVWMWEGNGMCPALHALSRSSWGTSEASPVGKPGIRFSVAVPLVNRPVSAERSFRGCGEDCEIDDFECLFVVNSKKLRLF